MTHLEKLDQILLRDDNDDSNGDDDFFWWLGMAVAGTLVTVMGMGMSIDIH